MKRFLILLVALEALSASAADLPSTHYSRQLLRANNSSAAVAALGMTTPQIPSPAFQTSINNDGSFDSFPVMAMSPDRQTWYCVFRRAAVHLQTNSALLMITTTNLGSSWSDPLIVVTNAGYDSRNHAFGVSASGRLIISYQPWNLATGEWEAPRFKYSDSGGYTWSPEGTLTGYTHALSSSVQASPYGSIKQEGGKLHFGLYNGPNVGYASYDVQSSDDGVTWTLVQSSSTTINGFPEPEICPINRTNLHMVGRTQTAGAFAGRQPSYWSTNDGATWTFQGYIPNPKTNSTGFPVGLTKFTAAGQGQIAMAVGDRQDNAIYLCSGSVPDVYADQTVLTNRTGSQGAIMTSGTGEGGYVSIISPNDDGNIFGAYYYWISSSEAQIRFFQSPVKLRLKGDASLLSGVTATVTSTVFRASSDAIGVFPIKVEDSSGTGIAYPNYTGSSWSWLVDDGSANRIGRIAYSRFGALNLAADTMSVNNGALVAISGTNTVYGNPMGINLRSGTGGRVDILNNTAIPISTTNGVTTISNLQAVAQASADALQTFPFRVRSATGTNIFQPYYQGSYWGVLMEDGSANRIARPFYSRTGAFAISADSGSVNEGALLTLSGTNTVYSNPNGITLKSGTTGRIELANNAVTTLSVSNGVLTIVGGGKIFVGTAQGLTTNILASTGSATNQLQFTAGILTGVVPQ